MGFLYCLLYMSFLGIIAYPVGRIIALLDPDPDGFFFRERPWEDGGRIYEKLGIKKWQAKIPDVSKVLKRGMPQKKLKSGFDAQSIKTMIRETCVAESVHSMLCVAGLWMLRLWAGIGGIILYAVYVLLGNVPFIIVQRYNRPRLRKLEKRLEEKEAAAAAKLEALKSEPAAE